MPLLLLDITYCNWKKKVGENFCTFWDWNKLSQKKDSAQWEWNWAVGEWAATHAWMFEIKYEKNTLFSGWVVGKHYKPQLIICA